MDVATDRFAVEQATAELVEAVNSGDVDAVISVWSEHGVLMPPHHPAVHGRVAIEAYFRLLFERAKLKFVFTESAIHVDGDTAIERITYTAEISASGSGTSFADRGKGLHVYRREAGAWKLAIDVWNSDAPSYRSSR
jgi:uncharacterized protein (TIGR02246 family)